MSPPPELVGIGDGAGYFVAGGGLFSNLFGFFLTTLFALRTGSQV